jgi:hypothetical protein
MGLSENQQSKNRLWGVKTKNAGNGDSLQRIPFYALYNVLYGLYLLQIFILKFDAKFVFYAQNHFQKFHGVDLHIIDQICLSNGFADVD